MTTSLETIQCFLNCVIITFRVCIYHVYTHTEISVEMETSKEHDVDNVEHEQ